MTDTDDEKKAKVLHTRVPESLENELKTRARGLGLSVSTLVRNILANTFGLVEDIVTDSANVARSARGEGGGETGELGEAPPDRIIGWQEAILNVNAVCSRCNALLPKGSKAGISVRERGGSKTIICEECLNELTTNASS